MDEYRTDVIVIGSGAAGLRASIAASESGAGVVLLAKGTAGLGTATILSYGALASGGFGQSIEEHIRKTMETGYHKNDHRLVKMLCDEAPACIWELRHKGLELRETSHGVVAAGRFPVLGRQIIQRLVAWAREVNVRMVNWVTAVDLIVSGGQAVGCVGVTALGQPVILKANAVVLCTGGASALFKFHDNPVTNIGEGYGMASRCGVDLKDMEFIQFYPLLIYSAQRPKILAPPSLVEKGEIVNDAGENIVTKYGLSGVRPIAIRGRDILSVCLYREMKEGKKIYLDLRGLNSSDASLDPADRHILRFLEERYQSRSDLLPVMPCAHFTIGGVVIDENCATSRKGLFAAGEAACGLHGANRMGGNALTETLVFGRRAGNAAAAFSLDRRSSRVRASKAKHSVAELFDSLRGRKHPSNVMRNLREIMWEQCGPERDQRGLSWALREILKLREEGIVCTTSMDRVSGLAVLNSLETARVIVESASKRGESIGAHQRVP